MSTRGDPVTVRAAAQRSPRWLWVIVFVAAAPALLEGVDSNLFAFGGPFIVHNVHATVASLGLLATGYALGIAVFSLVGGYLFDRISVKGTVLVSVVIFAGATLWTGYAVTLGELFASRFLVGIGVGMFQPALVALLGDILWETRSRAISIFALFFQGGIFIAPLFESRFLPAYRVPFLVASGVALILLVVFYAVIPKTFKTQRVTRAPLRGLMNRNVMVLTLSVLCFGIALFGFTGYFSAYLLKGLGMAPGVAAPIAGAAGLGGFLCAFPIGYLADRFGRKPFLVVAAVLVMMGSFGMFLVGRDVAGLILSTACFGAGWGSIVHLVAALGQDSVPDTVAGSVTGWMFMAFNVGAMMGGPLFAAFLAHGYVTAGLVTLGGASVLSLGFALSARSVTESNVVPDSAPASASM